MHNNGNVHQGAHSPDARVVAMGIYPIQSIASKVVEQDDVSDS